MCVKNKRSERGAGKRDPRTLNSACDTGTAPGIKCLGKDLGFDKAFTTLFADSSANYVCVCEREREGGRERGRERERESAREREKERKREKSEKERESERERARNRLREREHQYERERR